MSDQKTKHKAGSDAAPAHQPSMPEIEADLATSRAHLERTLDELVTRAAPKALAQRGFDKAKQAGREALFTADGSLRIERVAAVGSAVALLASLSLWRRHRRHHRR